MAAWRWRHMKINGHRWMVPMSGRSKFMSRASVTATDP